MAKKKASVFTCAATEGALLPAELLEAVAAGSKDIDGLSPERYFLAPGERIGAAVARSWSRLTGLWSAFRSHVDALPEANLATGPTRERWLLPLFDELGFGKLPVNRAAEIEGKRYPISHMHQATPVHLVGARIDLDRRVPGAAGAARTSPHSLVQEFLNRSDGHLWAMVSNGLKLRVLRDNLSFTRQAYVEFDLETMFDGELYADFLLLWLVCHASRFAGERPEECWLEKWSQAAQERGARALDALREGVKAAIEELGRGFLAPGLNPALKAKLHRGDIGNQEFYRQLLRMVYRLLFLFVAEDRNLLLAEDAAPAARERYARWYSTARLRELSRRPRTGARHVDLGRWLFLVFEKMQTGAEALGVSPLGGFLWGDTAMPDLAGCDISNLRLLAAVRALAWTVDHRVLRPVDFKNLGAEELGSVYESLLELHPELDPDGGRFELKTAAGHERKSTGSYYTPAGLISRLLDSALEPVLAEKLALAGRMASGEWKAVAQRVAPEERDEMVRAFSASGGGEGRGVAGNAGGSGVSASLPSAKEMERLWAKTPLATRYSQLAEQLLLNTKICDPACGSGHFLVAAAHRLAKKLASVRTGDEEPDPGELRRALRDVIGRCIYGVDINPMSVELCKVGLWMEAMAPGKPLSFLDHHIQCGNSLIGATPRLLEAGIPDAAFQPIEGDDKEVCKTYKRENRDYRSAVQKQQTLFAAERGFPWERLGNLPAAFRGIDLVADDTPEGVRRRQKKYEEVVNSAGYEFGRRLADAWCAAFVWKKIGRRDHPYPVTQELFEKIERNPHGLSFAHKQEIDRLSAEYQFFHWHLAFPDVFWLAGKGEKPENEGTGWSGGFDCVVGNPPWERIKLQEKEWFAERSPDVAAAPNAAARGRMIRALQEDDPAIYRAFLADKRKSEGQSHLARNSGLFPFCGRGDINTYSIFAELKRDLLSSQGRVGCIVPSGIATDDTTKFFFQDLMDSGSLVSLHDFENRKKIFPGIDSRIKFSLVTMAGRERPAGSAADFVFFALEPAELAQKERHFTLSADDIALINPNTRTCPIFRGKPDAELTKMIYRRVPVLIREPDPNRGISGENPWGISFQRMLDMSNDSGLFRTRDELLDEGYELRGNVFEQTANGEPRTATDSPGDSPLPVHHSPLPTRYLPLYEAKMIHHYDHRWATYQPDGLVRDMTAAEKKDPDRLPMPRYWVADREVYLRLARLPRGLISALRDGFAKGICLGVAHLLFAVALHDGTGGDVETAVGRVFEEWKDFVARHPFAGDIAPTQMGLCGKSGARLGPSDGGCLPAVSLGEMADLSPREMPAWYSVKPEAVETFLALGASYADRIFEPPPLSEAADALAYAEALLAHTSPKWLMGWRDICRSTDERTVIGSLIPQSGVGHTCPLAFFENEESHFFLGCLASFANDFVARQKIGGTHLTYNLFKQIPFVPPSWFGSNWKWNLGKSALSDWFFASMVELVYSGADVEIWGQDGGYSGPPFKWNEQRRFLIRCELDAAFFHLYLGTESEWRENGSEALLAYFPTPRHAVEYIMETFPIVKRKDEAAHGAYRTKETILQFYDAMKTAMETGAPYQTPLDPPPGPPADADGNFIPVHHWDPDNWPPHIHQPRERR